MILQGICLSCLCVRFQTWWKCHRRRSLKENCCKYPAEDMIIMECFHQRNHENGILVIGIHKQKHSQRQRDTFKLLFQSACSQPGVLNLSVVAWLWLVLFHAVFIKKNRSINRSLIGCTNTLDWCVFLWYMYSACWDFRKQKGIRIK